MVKGYVTNRTLHPYDAEASLCLGKQKECVLDACSHELLPVHVWLLLFVHTTVCFAWPHGSSIKGNTALLSADRLSSFQRLDHLLVFSPFFPLDPMLRDCRPRWLTSNLLPFSHTHADVPLEGNGKEADGKLSR